MTTQIRRENAVDCPEKEARPASGAGVLAGEGGAASEARVDLPPAHGGDRVAFAARYGCDPLDFSVNVNPYGISPAARAAAVRALDVADRYPDPFCRELTAAIARSCGVEECQVLVGSGASDIIFRLARAAAPRRAVVCAPTFSEYRQALEREGCTVRSWQLDPATGYRLDAGFLNALAGADVAFLCEPNNPTGQLDDPALLRRVLDRCEQEGCLLVVDECFNGFLSDPAAASLRGLVPSHPRLAVIDAFTKTHGMAGLRLGYLLCADSALMDAARAAGVPWAVSSVAQAAGVAALDDAAHVQKARDLAARERPRLAAGLERLGFRTVPSQANYLLALPFVDHLPAKLARRGIMVRDCDTYEGLPAGCVRFAVRLPDENDRLLEELAHIVADECEGASASAEIEEG